MATMPRVSYFSRGKKILERRSSISLKTFPDVILKLYESECEKVYYILPFYISTPCL